MLGGGGGGDTPRSNIGLLPLRCVAVQAILCCGLWVVWRCYDAGAARIYDKPTFPVAGMPFLVRGASKYQSVWGLFCFNSVSRWRLVTACAMADRHAEFLYCWLALDVPSAVRQQWISWQLSFPRSKELEDEAGRSWSDTRGGYTVATTLTPRARCKVR